MIRVLISSDRSVMARAKAIADDLRIMLDKARTGSSRFRATDRRDLLNHIAAMIAKLRGLLSGHRQRELNESGSIPPLTPAALRKRSVRDQDRQQRAKDVVATAAIKANAIRMKMGR